MFSKKQDIQDIFIETNFMKLVFNMIWLMEILKIKTEEQLLIKYNVRKHLTLLKIQKMMDANVNLFQWFYKCFDKETSGGTVKNENISNKELSRRITQTNF